MELKEKGYTLVELVVVMALISMIASLMITSSKWVEEKKLHMKTDEVAAAVEYVKQAASATGESYALAFGKKEIYVRDNSNTLFKVKLEQNQEFPNSLRGEYMWFNGKQVSSFSTTISIENKSIHKVGKVAVRVATSKVRVYYEKM